MRIIYFIQIILLLPLLNGQEWTQTYGVNHFEKGKSGMQTNDGGYIIVGETRQFEMSTSDLLLIKIDNQGNEEWQQVYGGPIDYSNTGDEAYSVQQTIDGGYVIIGSTGYMSNGYFDFWIIKTDSYGNEIWNKTFGVDNNNSDHALSGHQTSDGGYILGGIMGFCNSWLIKIDDQGNEVWNKIFDLDECNRIQSVQQTSDGGYILLGRTTSISDGSYDVWLVKTDSNGDTVWTKTFGGNDTDSGYCVRQTADGGYVIVGNTNTFGSGDYDIWLIKTTSDGNLTWSSTIGGTESDRASSIRQTSDGGYIISGYTSSFGDGSSDAWIIKTDSNGDTVWTKTFGGTEYDRANSLSLTDDGGFFIVGETESFGNGGKDIWVINTYETLTVKGTYLYPETFRLYKNYPNPFNPITSLRYDLPKDGLVNITVYDMMGRIVKTLVNSSQTAGYKAVQWNATDNINEPVSAGLYLYTIQAGEFRQTKKMVLLK